MRNIKIVKERIIFFQNSLIHFYSIAIYLYNNLFMFKKYNDQNI